MHKLYLYTMKTSVTRMDIRKKKNDLHVCRVGARGGHEAIDKSFKMSKRTRCSGIVGKAIPQLWPTVKTTSF